MASNRTRRPLRFLRECMSKPPSRSVPIEAGIASTLAGVNSIPPAPESRPAQGPWSDIWKSATPKWHLIQQPRLGYKASLAMNDGRGVALIADPFKGDITEPARSFAGAILQPRPVCVSVPVNRAVRLADLRRRHDHNHYR